MLVTSNPSRQQKSHRAAPLNRRMVVPDRMIKQTKVISPIINLQPIVAPTHKSLKKPSNIRRHPILSSKVHISTKINEYKMVKRPKSRQVEPSAAEVMDALMKRHNILPKHLARTAYRAHLLSDTLRKDSQKLRWHQKIFAKLLVNANNA